MCDGERGSGPEGANDLCFVIFYDLGLKVSINNGILALRLGFEPLGWNLTLKGGGTDGGEEGGGEISPMYESIGHRPLRGCCPKGDGSTDRPTDRHSGVSSRKARDQKASISAIRLRLDFFLCLNFQSFCFVKF